MSPVQRVIVLSDLHLGPDNLLSTFRDEEALAALFDRFSEEADAPRTELILAGDLFDFLISSRRKGGTEG